MGQMVSIPERPASGAQTVDDVVFPMVPEIRDAVFEFMRKLPAGMPGYDK